MIVASANSNKYEVKISLDGNDAIKPIIAVQPMELGGTGMDMRPGHLILSGFAGCIHVTAREILDEQKLIYDDVIVAVHLLTDDFFTLVMRAIKIYFSYKFVAYFY